MKEETKSRRDTSARSGPSGEALRPAFSAPPDTGLSFRSMVSNVTEKRFVRYPVANVLRMGEMRPLLKGVEQRALTRTIADRTCWRLLENPVDRCGFVR